MIGGFTMDNWPESVYIVDEITNLLGAKIVCQGLIGSVFTISNPESIGGNLTVEITESSKSHPTITGAGYEVVNVRAGTHAVIVTQNAEQVASLSITAVSGTTYWTIYNIDTLVFNSDVPGTYNVLIPEGMSEVSVTAVAGGGGGTTGQSGTTTTGGNGGSGGSAGEKIKNSIKNVTPLSTLTITIGTGGRGETVNDSALAGTPTLLTGFVSGDVTLAGGIAGGVSGGAKGINGGSGMLNPTNGGTGSNNGGSINGGTAIVLSNYGYPGGGGGAKGMNAGVTSPTHTSLYLGGSGGSGGYITSSGTRWYGDDGGDGLLGSGGGGGAGASGGDSSTHTGPLTSRKKGGKGGDGYVDIRKRISFVGGI